MAIVERTEVYDAKDQLWHRVARIVDYFDEDGKVRRLVFYPRGRGEDYVSLCGTYLDSHLRTILHPPTHYRLSTAGATACGHTNGRFAESFLEITCPACVEAVAKSIALRVCNERSQLIADSPRQRP